MPEIPDVYSDSVMFSTSLWGVSISFMATLVPPTPAVTSGDVVSLSQISAQQKAIVRMSLQHAKAMLLRRSLKEWENTNGEINIPEGVYQDLRLSSDEW